MLFYSGINRQTPAHYVMQYSSPLLYYAASSDDLQYFKQIITEAPRGFFSRRTLQIALDVAVDYESADIVDYLVRDRRVAPRSETLQKQNGCTLLVARYKHIKDRILHKKSPRIPYEYLLKERARKNFILLCVCASSLTGNKLCQRHLSIIFNNINVRT